MKSFFAAALFLTTCLLIFGWFDHHAAEYDPQHIHLAPGLLGIALDLGMLSHAHAFAIDHLHGDDLAASRSLMSGAKTVVTAAVSLYATGDKMATAVLPRSDEVAVDLRQMEAFVPRSNLWFPAVDLDVLDPPPRSA
jgi:N-acyl-D-aspartate/D-glutamate deacylase